MAVAVFFRYDDLSARSPVQIDRAVMEAFAARRLQLSVGVIPFICRGDPHSRAKQALLPVEGQARASLLEMLRIGAVDVALHGRSHQNRRAPRSRYPSEFAGLGQASQQRRMREAKVEIEGWTGVKIRTFVPPWNHYDAATLRAAEEAGFDYFSAGLRGPAPKSGRLKMIPAAIGSMDGVRTAVGLLAPAGVENRVLGVLLHPTDFVLPAGGRDSQALNRLEKLLDWLSSADGIEIKSISQIAASALTLSFTENSPGRFLPRLLKRAKTISAAFLE